MIIYTFHSSFATVHRGAKLILTTSIIMADEVVVEQPGDLGLTINETDVVTNVTEKIPATPEGMAVAYGSLVIMAIVPIFFGAYRSVKFHKEQKDNGETPEVMSDKDAAMFPIIASATLFGIYVVFQIFSKEYINILLTVYFFFLGVLSLAHIAGPYVTNLIPSIVPNEEYHLLLTSGKADKKEVSSVSVFSSSEMMNYKFDHKDLINLALCGIFGGWYLLKKHWIANNIFGLAFALNGIEFLQLNTVMTGCILLGGLFIYDIFWVFGTNVMVTVAKSFEAPIKLVFPQDILEKGLEANNFAMLGLGDIVIPGIFIALLLRYDVSKKKSHTYFYAGFTAYLLGLLMTIGVMHFFKHAQPALLYLVPACIGLPLFVALVKGEIKQLFLYEDNPETDKDKKTEETKESKEEEEKKAK
ncbi:Minor histocompatibility antigen H13 [Holothuria leucospilota]|uniref:Minor histocompatibility antigen H13 n=1 Tax=Holothuria leucospilota TaxID=206669 RepID=A0A9Q1BUB3_HOLLE|nr:Minor histocompatibility antigen H13 [Holothuria leucospilota]